MKKLAKYFKYLDDLRESGRTNMYASALFLEETFGLDDRKASEIVRAWMRTFDLTKTPAERAKSTDITGAHEP